ncbi:Zinc finger MYND domain-containing 10 [Chlorella sorokiniana]|uniref:phytol kinase n=1 Tax=Chlorella sorokiniana TaxID=3076 RepID=A0A2P6TR64_CHLSO|nr:Zinc finger MYND domain-containing 10 [Chlorella sorokiniana]|eukprot:PRW56533.1 Zinc finger MYND domain-containing 10 [Chlorella sorokiniana]
MSDSRDLEFLLERAERARQLLSQDSHRGDADVQHFVAEMDALADLHGLFLNDDCTEPRQGLTEQQKQQLKKCSKCSAVAYCSRECQVRHWQEGGHKAECSRLAAERRK